MEVISSVLLLLEEDGFSTRFVSVLPSFLMSFAYLLVSFQNIHHSTTHLISWFSVTVLVSLPFLTLSDLPFYSCL